MKSKPDIVCLGCRESIYIILKNSYIPWDWDRELCGECSSFIPNYIPEEQYNWYKEKYKNDLQV